MNEQGIVGRAELKLAGAVKAFGYDFRGKTVLDIGSSTGGFTGLALKQGARKVYAVEKGTNQMKAPLRFDARVVLMEKTDIFEVGRGCKVELPERIDTIVADVSFVSLRKVLAHVRKKIAERKTDFLVMLKPQFEAREEYLVKGVLKNERMRREVIKDFERWVVQNGFIIVAKRDNELVGKNGNRERFYWLEIAERWRERTI